MHCTEVGLPIFLSVGFAIAIVVNPPDKKTGGIYQFSVQLINHRCVSCPLVLVCVLVHLHCNLVSSVLVTFQIG